MWHLSTQVPHPYLDDPSQWSSDTALPYFGVLDYQKKIDEIVGTNRDGKPIIRIVSATESFTYAFGERQPYYWIRRIPDGEGYIYHTVKRFIFEKRLEPETYVDSWNAQRYSLQDPETLETIDLGEPPSEWYRPEGEFIAEHDPNKSCCTRLFQKEQKLCYGYFRLPNESDLDRLRKSVRERDARKYQDPYKPLSMDALKEIAWQANDVVRQEQIRLRNLRREMIDEFTAKNRWRLKESDPRVLKFGRTSVGDANKALQYFKQRKSGIIVPN
jgi:hypothetical protein